MSQQTLQAADAPSVSIVLVNYKTREITSICLELLRKAIGDADIPVWVVDNDSADDSTEYLRSLDWIQLIERKSPGKETGALAHGRALDMVLERVTTDYLLLMHTDTFIYDPAILERLLQQCRQDDKIVAVGCVEQMYRGPVRIVWRLVSRFCKHYFRRFKIWLGLSSRPPKPYCEVYLKSFCALWNVNLIKKHGMSFAMAERIPGYEMQDRMMALGYKIAYVSARTMFAYLDHIQAGTVTAIGGYQQGHRRAKIYSDILSKIDRD